jgi:putative chitinase
MVAADQLRKIMPHCSFLRITAFAPWLNKTMDEFHINSEPRITAFLAQIAHESCELRYVEEIASGRAYEGRKDMVDILPALKDGAFRATLEGIDCFAVGSFHSPA